MKRLFLLSLVSLFLLTSCGNSVEDLTEESFESFEEPTSSIESVEEPVSSNESSEITSAPVNVLPHSSMVEVWCAAPSVSEEELHSIVLEARQHLGNYNGNVFWQWYGFSNYTAWCACFVSYCGAKTGIDFPKFAWVQNGVDYFQGIGKWQDRGYTPKSGDIIFFKYEGFSQACHVGIVECVVDGKVYTIEGNYNNSCQRARYSLNWNTIMGYGVI